MTKKTQRDLRLQNKTGSIFSKYKILGKCTLSRDDTFDLTRKTSSNRMGLGNTEDLRNLNRFKDTRIVT